MIWRLTLCQLSVSSKPSAAGRTDHESNHRRTPRPVPSPRRSIASPPSPAAAPPPSFSPTPRNARSSRHRPSPSWCPLAQILASALVTALYFAFGRRAGTFGLVAYLLNAFALAALAGVEFVINLVFKHLPAETIQALRAGPLGVALTAASMLFLLGTLTFVAAMLRSREIPPAPLVLYAIGAIPISLRAFVTAAAFGVPLRAVADRLPPGNLPCTWPDGSSPAWPPSAAMPSSSASVRDVVHPSSHSGRPCLGCSRGLACVG